MSSTTEAWNYFLVLTNYISHVNLTAHTQVKVFAWRYS